MIAVTTRNTSTFNINICLLILFNCLHGLVFHTSCLAFSVSGTSTLSICSQPSLGTLLWQYESFIWHPEYSLPFTDLVTDSNIDILKIANMFSDTPYLLTTNWNEKCNCLTTKLFWFLSPDPFFLVMELRVKFWFMSSEHVYCTHI